jgi:hypothetical protein
LIKPISESSQKQIQTNGNQEGETWLPFSLSGSDEVATKPLVSIRVNELGCVPLGETQQDHHAPSDETGSGAKGGR